MQKSSATALLLNRLQRNYEYIYNEVIQLVFKQITNKKVFHFNIRFALFSVVRSMLCSMKQLLLARRSSYSK